jgi:hypothetical protein
MIDTLDLGNCDLMYWLQIWAMPEHDPGLSPPYAAGSLLCTPAALCLRG